MPTKSNTSNMRKLLLITGAALFLLLLSLLLAWISSGNSDLQGFGSFFLTGIFCTGLIAGTWWAVQATEKKNLPTGLLGLTLLAITFRLVAGIIWFTALPRFGHNSPAEQAGYVMSDAYHRDKAAWELAKSDAPLWSSFRNQRTVDQYGGLLFLSGLVYRYFSADVHLPLQMILITATISGLAILLIWALIQRLWVQKTAWIGAWIIALFPDAILLGSTQMREGFTITLTIAAFYGLIGYLQDHIWPFLIWLVGAVLLFLPYSPPFTALLIMMFAFTAVFIRVSDMNRSSDSSDLFHTKRFWFVSIIVCLLVLTGIWFALDQFTPDKITDPISMINWWLNKSADLQAHLTERSSGMIQAIFDRTPEWTHTYLLLAYGVAQPFLPAAIIATSDASIWQGIAIWRALGWTFLLILLLYATIRAWGKNGDTYIRLFVILVWVTILIASFRGGGDLWDNPRYRVTFLGLQAVVASWAWVTGVRTNDRILRYLVIWIIVTVLWLIPWYLYRKFSLHWPIEDFFLTLGLAIVTTLLIVLIDQIRIRIKNH